MKIVGSKVSLKDAERACKNHNDQPVRQTFWYTVWDGRLQRWLVVSVKRTG